MKTYKIRINSQICEFECSDVMEAYNIGLTAFGYILSFDQIKTPLTLIKIDYDIVEKTIFVKLNGKNIIEIFSIPNNFNYENLYKEVVKILELDIEVI